MRHKGVLGGRLSYCVVLLAAAAHVWSACGAPVAPTPSGVSAIDAQEAIGQMAIAFLNRFAASSVSPEACLVDFADSCRGKRDELSDIEFNREHYVIIGTRLGQPNVAIRAGGQTADVGVSCAFDSRVIKCEATDTNCRVGASSSVAGTCIMTGVREPGGWRLCTSNFALAPGPPPPGAASQFFGAGGQVFWR